MLKNTARTPEELMRDNLIVKHLAGSHAYGTAIGTSDVDYRGIFCADPINVRTPFYVVRECEDVTEEDTKLYELAHFMKLCVDCNPNIIETLWVDDADITFRTPAYDLLRENREHLLSSKIAFTTSGYAIAQLKRIKGHNKWINNPMKEEPPRQTDFIKLVHNFTEDKLFDINLEDFRDGFRLVPYTGNLYGLYRIDGYQTFSADYTLNTVYDPDEGFFTTAIDGDISHRRQPLFIIKFNKEEYNLATEKWKQYWSWKKNRNEKRGALEEQFGFDTKHAMHLVRLMRMGEEALTTGQIVVKRPDAEELLAIRDGAWTYEQIIEYSEEMDNKIRGDLYKNTHLRKKADVNIAANLLMSVQDSIWD